MKHTSDIVRRAAIMSEVTGELERQDEKWGVQDHNMHYWNTIITEELGESAEAAFEVESLENFAAARHYATELVHVAACAIQAVETLRRLHPEWDPEIKFDDSRKAILPRAENKGENPLQILPINEARRRLGLDILDIPDSADFSNDEYVTRIEQERIAGG